MDVQHLSAVKIRGQTIRLSIHYYVLSLSVHTSMLYEGFRDKLIDIQNTHFPFAFSMDTGSPASWESQFREFFHQTDQRFSRYYEQDPLRLVVTGEKSNLSLFRCLTTHWDIVIGAIEDDYTATSPHDLGKIVWPVVKQAIAGTNENAMLDLARAAEAMKIVSGIDAVGQSAETETGATLYVEEDFHMKGGIRRTDHSVIFSKHVNLWEVIDDVVDLIVEKVLKMGGTVIFLNSGSMMNYDRIALVQHG
jgi:hypothetical protein